MIPNVNFVRYDDMTRICNKLTIIYRNTINVNLSFLENESSNETSNNLEMLFRGIQFLMNLKDLGYVIPTTQSLQFLKIANTISVSDDTEKHKFNAFCEVVESILGGQEAKYTYKTLFGNGKLASDLIDSGNSPYFYQLVHYVSAYAGNTIDVTSLLVNESLDVKENKNSFANFLAEVSGASIKGIEEVLRGIFPKDTDEPTLQRLDICFVPESEALPMKIFEELIGSNNPMSATIKLDVKTYLKFLMDTEPSRFYGKDAYKWKVPCKETLAFLTVNLIKNGFPANPIVDNINNATDVLRIFAMYSDPDYDGSLSTPPRFKNHLNTTETKFFMDLLRHAPHVDTDIFMYPEYWKRAFERIKPQRCIGKKYKKIKDVAENLWNGKKPQTPNATVEKILLHGGESLQSFEQGLEKLENFPGMYLRHFDKYIRSYGKKLSDDSRENRHFQYLVCQSLHRVVSQVESTKMLCELMILYYKRLDDLKSGKKSIRYAKPKARTSYVPLLPIKEPLCEKTYLKSFYNEILNILTQEITYRFKELSYLGKVYIDPTASGVVVPTELREANDTGIHIISRGSYFKLLSANEVPGKPENEELTDVYVPYIHWAGPYDIDLSVAFMKENFEIVSTCNYCDMSKYVPDEANGRRMYVSHSGDFIDGGPLDGEGVAEFVMIRRQFAMQTGARYAAITVHSYSGEVFSTAKPFFGFEMLAENVAEKKMESLQNDCNMTDRLHAVVKPDCTILTTNLSSTDTATLLCIIDMKENVLYYADLGLSGSINNLKFANEGSRTLDKLATNEDKGDDPYKAYINPYGNNIMATALSMGTQIRALFEKPRFYCGDLMWLHAQVRGMVVKRPEDADVIFTLPDSTIAKNMEDDQEIITPFMADRIVNEFMPTK